MAALPKYLQRSGQGALQQQLQGHKGKDQGKSSDGLQTEGLPLYMRPDDKGPYKGPTEIATKQLRHSGPDTTYRIYAQIKSDTDNDEVNNLFPQKEVASIPNVSCLMKHPDGK
jgi:hypothetical protein